MATPFKPRTTAIVLCMAALFCAGLYEAQSQPYFVYQRTFHETGESYQDGYEIVQTSDGGYAIGGFYGGPPMGIGTFYLIKADAMGEYQWTGAMCGESYFGTSLRQTSDNGYIMAGYYGTLGVGNAVRVTKYTSTGANAWHQQFQIFDNRTNVLNQVNAANCIRQTSDSGYILTGYTALDTGSRKDLFLAKLRNDGSVNWIRQWEDIATDNCSLPSYLVGNAVEQTSDGGYIIAGEEIWRTNNQ